MNNFLHWLIARWFATMTPAHAPLITIDARETMRKRRLLSIILLIAFSGLFFTVVTGIITRTQLPQQIQNMAGICFIALSFWINRSGRLKLASLCYLLSSLMGLAAVVVTSSLSVPILAFGLWPLLLILPVAAGLILPAWGPLLLALIEDTFWCWFVLYGGQKQITIYLTRPSDQLMFLLLMCIITSVVALFSAISAWATKKAVIQADRAVELEQAHHDLSEAYVTIQKQALTDALTGLPNHRAVVDQLEKEMDRARRYLRPFSLLFFDADHFKHVNDTFGHGAGDAVLCQIGQYANRMLRGGDTLGRFGGEEFVILLPEADVQEAQLVAERIRVTIAATPLAQAEVPEGIPMTVSMGIATYPVDGYAAPELLQQADEAMYLSKRLGRNQVRTAAESRQSNADPALLVMLQEAERDESLQRSGYSPDEVKQDGILKMISSLLFLVEQRDPAMNEHSRHVSELATAIAQELALQSQEIFLIGIAGLLHDIGKVGLPDTLLQKPGQLSLRERALLREHPDLGAQILQANPFLKRLAPAVRHHHERWDGTGYPDQLVGENIPLAARIIGIAEAYDVMLRRQAYQGTRTPQEAIAELQRGAAMQFDPTLVRILLKVLTHQQAPSLVGS